MVLNNDFREFIKLLNENSVRYLIVGGYAVTIHGYPRFTNDIDIWLDREESNAQKVIEVLKGFGFDALNIGVHDILIPDRIIQLGYPPNRIDLLTGIDGVTFKECYSKKHIVAIDNLEVDFIGLSDLLKNKRTSARHKDLDDIQNLTSQ